MFPIFKKALQKSYSYKEYRTLVSKLISQGKSTGNEQSADLLQYSELNNTKVQSLCVISSTAHEKMGYRKNQKDGLTNSKFW
jgi:hypothetical protein